MKKHIFLFFYFYFFLFSVKAHFPLTPELKNEIVLLSTDTLHVQQHEKVSFPLLEARSSGVFITIEKEGRTLACLGDIRPHFPNLKLEIEELWKKLVEDPHFFSKLNLTESSSWTIWVRFPERAKKVRDLSSIDPKKDGVLAKSESKAALALPGEAKTRRYLFLLLRQKAGLSPRDTVVYYRIPSPGFSFHFFGGQTID